MILKDFLKAVAQLSDPRFRRVLWLGIGLTLALLIGIYALFLWALHRFAPDTITLPLIGEFTSLPALLSLTSLFMMLTAGSANVATKPSTKPIGIRSHVFSSEPSACPIIWPTGKKPMCTPCRKKANPKKVRIKPKMI